MKKLIYIVCLIVFVACKEDAKKDESTPVTEVEEKTIVLSNYSDENWDKGVAIELNMFLVDLTDKNKELLENVKELELVDGTIVKVTGINIAEPFIQINTLEKAEMFKEKASHPNIIFIK